MKRFIQFKACGRSLERFNIMTTVAEKNTGDVVASRLTKFKNEAGQTYKKIQLNNQ